MENNSTHKDSASINQELQLVVFDLAEEFYGVDIGDVREIIRMQGITRIPGAPNFVEGVINLRGKVVPVIDLRKRLNREAQAVTKESRIVVMHNISGSDVGVIVDGVNEVLRIPLGSIEPPSSMITETESDYLRGIAKLESKLIILLDLNKALASINNKLNAIDMEKVNSSSDISQEVEGSKSRKEKAGAAA
jgi:purine-binding chemotaxis protein CheW